MILFDDYIQVTYAIDSYNRVMFGENFIFEIHFGIKERDTIR